MSAKLVAIGVFLGIILYIILIGHRKALTHSYVEESEKILGEKVVSTDRQGDSDSILPTGLNSKEACFMLKQKYKIESGQSLGRRAEAFGIIGNC